VSLIVLSLTCPHDVGQYFKREARGAKPEEESTEDAFNRYAWRSAAEAHRTRRRMEGSSLLHCDASTLR